MTRKGFTDMVRQVIIATTDPTEDVRRDTWDTMLHWCVEHEFLPVAALKWRIPRELVIGYKAFKTDTYGEVR